jgi:transcriptional regulator with XRE-family HTH domain
VNARARQYAAISGRTQRVVAVDDVDEQQAAIGARIARHRSAARLTQQELADAANISLSLERKIEAGKRRTSAAVLERLAPRLGATAEELTGAQAARPASAGPSAHAMMRELHGALARYDLPVDLGREPRSPAALRAAVSEVNRLRNLGGYSRLGPLLPDLIDELILVAHQTAGEQQRRATYRQLVVVYFAAHAMSYKLGHDHLATIAEGCISGAAERTGDPLLTALAAWTRCTTFLATGGPSFKAGLRLLERTRGQLEPLLSRDDPQVLSVYGALHLREAVLAARDAQGGLAHAHLDEARVLVQRGARDENPQSLLTSGPVNSSIVAAAVDVELGDAPAALRRAASLVIPHVFPRVRAGHHHVDMARAYLWLGRLDQSLESLLAAERLAPQQTRHHPDAHSTLRTLSRLHRRCPPHFNGLVQRIKHSGAPDPLR